MSELNFEKEHQLGLDQALATTRRLAETMSNDYGVKSTWDQNTLQFARSGVRGELTVSADRLVLVARLGPLLAAFTPRIKERLEQNFDTWYGPDASAT